LETQEGLLAIYKPAGVHVFGVSSICSWLISRHPELSKIGPKASPAILHRLDRGTSGLLLAASTEKSFEKMRKDFSQQRIKKTYLALVEGLVNHPLVLKGAIGSRYRHSKKVHVVDGKKFLRGIRPAETRIFPMQVKSGFSLCRVEMTTGVRHQIRVHLSQRGHPLVGDDQYGAKDDLGLEERFFLHAWQARLQPAEGSQEITIEAKLSPDLKKILCGLRMTVDL
jgi:23S rRNA-/tRNA-specific pseudouridylate synthase